MAKPENQDDRPKPGPLQDPTTIASEDSGTSSPLTTHSQIGPYKLLNQTGEGGMGQVFVAEQKKPFRRKVALKIIKPGMDSKEVLSRFEAERQALALMDHTNIARVYDAGTTKEGLPYFAMELVEGKPITEFCDERKLSLKQRLDLFRQVCHAVQHAHQKGIIHRDLKPSNILVTTDSGKQDEPIPKIIDFGVAKALGPGLTENTLYTMAGQIIGTPQYMSPEQAVFDATDVDTRADIYSLGVLLYELLTGRTPMEMAELNRVGIDAMLKTIREEEAPRPSAKLSKLENDAQTTIADARQVPRSKLTHLLRGDLDWIVMKALEKERGRRYETANAFAADIKRYLANEPVDASPPSPAYRFKKYASRNKGAIAAMATVMIVLIGGIATTAWQAAAARAEEARAQAAREEAEKLVAFMMGDLSEKLARVGKLELMEEVEVAVSRYFDSATETENAAALILPMVDNLMRQGETYRRQGRLIEAVDILTQAIGILEEHQQKLGEDLSFDLAKAHYIRSEVALMQRDTNEASKDRRTALRLLESPNKNSRTAYYEIELLVRIKAEEAIHEYTSLQNVAKGQAMMEEALDLNLKLIDDHPKSAQAKVLLIRNRIRGFHDLNMGPTQEWKEALEISNIVHLTNQLVEENPNDVRLNAEVLRILIHTMPRGNRLIDLLEAGENGEKVSPAILAKQLVELDPDNKEWQILHGETNLEIGYHLSEAGLPEESLPYFDEALRVLTGIDADQGGLTTFSLLGEVYSERGFAHQRLRDMASARIDYEAGHELMNSHLDLVKQDADWCAQMAEIQFRLASIVEDPKKALEILYHAETLLTPICEASPTHEWLHRTMMYVKNYSAKNYVKLGYYDRARELFDQSIEICQRFHDLYPGWDMRFDRTLRSAYTSEMVMGDLERARSLKLQELSRVSFNDEDSKGDKLASYAEFIIQAFEFDLDRSEVSMLEEEIRSVEQGIEEIWSRVLQPEYVFGKLSEVYQAHAEFAFRNGSSKIAATSLEKSEDHLISGWERKSEITKYHSDLALGMKKNASLQSQLGNEAKTEELLKLSLSWWEAICKAEAEPDGKHLWEWGGTAQALLSQMGKWKRSNEEKLPYQILRADKRLAGWEAGFQATHRAGEVITALVVLGQSYFSMGEHELARDYCLKALTILPESDGITRSQISPPGKVHLAIVGEVLGQLAASEENWQAAEDYYRQSIEAWLEPDAFAGGPGNLMAQRTKFRLSSVYRDSGRGDDPQVQKWHREIYETLDSANEAGELPPSLNWVLNAAKGQIQPASTPPNE